MAPKIKQPQATSSSLPQKSGASPQSPFLKSSQPQEQSQPPQNSGNSKEKRPAGNGGDGAPISAHSPISRSSSWETEGSSESEIPLLPPSQEGATEHLGGPTSDITDLPDVTSSAAALADLPEETRHGLAKMFSKLAAARAKDPSNAALKKGFESIGTSMVEFQDLLKEFNEGSGQKPSSSDQPATSGKAERKSSEPFESNNFAELYSESIKYELEGKKLDPFDMAYRREHVEYARRLFGRLLGRLFGITPEKEETLAEREKEPSSFEPYQKGFLKLATIYLAASLMGYALTGAGI